MEHEPLVAHASAKDAPVGSSSSTARRVGLAVAGLAAAGVLAFSGKMTMSTIKTKSAEADLAEMPKLADDAFATPTKFVPDGNNWKVRPDVMNYAALKPNYAEMNEEAKKSKFDQFVTEHNRKYESDDEAAMRYTQFKENLKYIDALNQYNPLALFDITEAADYTAAERQRKRMTPTWSNYDSMKARLPQDMVAAAAKGPDNVLGKSFAAEPSKVSAKGLFSTDPAKDAEAGRRLGMSQGEVEWGSEDDCAACTRFPGFKKYTSDNRPTNFDWNALGAVSSVKNQKYCGSCWTFSTAQDIEGVHYLAGNDLVSLSEQQLVACDVANDGCDGGWMYAAMQYVTAIGGLVTDEAYPYKGVLMTYDLPTPTCDTSTLNSWLKADGSELGHIEGYQMVAMGAEFEDFLATYMLKNGPVSIAINANGMDYYVHGITGCETIAGSEYCEAGTIADTTPCDPEELDHGVLITAYGEQDGIDYWMIKNSWADTWGDNGYYRMIRGCNHCGVANMAQHSVYKKVSA
jgi:cathepsin F